jgi:hypothetical protein
MFGERSENHQQTLMNLSKILSARPSLMREARLANLAFAYATLVVFARRMRTLGIQGTITLQPAVPEQGFYVPVLHAERCNRSVLEEHFTDEDLLELVDVLAFVAPIQGPARFRMESFDELFLAPVARELHLHGIDVEAPPSSA